MLTSSVENAFRGMALVRAAEAMMRALGGEEITLLLPAISLPDDPAAQLGLADPGVVEVQISPVVRRTLLSDNQSSARRFEFLMPATAVASQIEAQNAASAPALFDAALGILHEGVLLRIQKVATEYFAGTAYLTRNWSSGNNSVPLSSRASAASRATLHLAVPARAIGRTNQPRAEAGKSELTRRATPNLCNLPKTAST
jgi:hypothetical protein